MEMILAPRRRPPRHGHNNSERPTTIRDTGWRWTVAGTFISRDRLAGIWMATPAKDCWISSSPNCASSGNRIGSQQFGTPGDDIAYAIAIDTSGNIYITGSTRGSLPGWTSSGDKDIFLAKFDSSGNTIFVKQFGTNQEDVAYGIAIDTSGNIYITGSSGGNLGTTSAGGLDIFLTKFDSSGNRIFTQQFGTNQDDIGYGVVVDNSGNIYITGSTKGILGSSSFGLLDVFLAKFNSSWVNQFIVQFGSDQDDVGYSIALSGTDNIYITGSTVGNLPGNTNFGLTDIFLAKFNSSGAKPIPPSVGNHRKRHWQFSGGRRRGKCLRSRVHGRGIARE